MFFDVSSFATNGTINDDVIMNGANSFNRADTDISSLVVNIRTTTMLQ